jgi:SET domain-containing protein
MTADSIVWIPFILLLSISSLLVAVGALFLYKLITLKHGSIDRQAEDKELEKNSSEDSQGDGLVLFDDPLFPEG